MHPYPVYPYGETPKNVITKAANERYPDGYRLFSSTHLEWSVISEAWNQDIDSHIEGITVRSTADAATGRVNIHPDEIATFLRRLYESSSDIAVSMRIAILSRLGIGEE